jgi:hypothetical protein
MNLVDLAEKLGLESSDLDDAVHDCAQDASLDVPNTLERDDEQEQHITEVEADAASINNRGLEGQIDFLLKHNGHAEVRALLEELAKEKAKP